MGREAARAVGRRTMRRLRWSIVGAAALLLATSGYAEAAKTGGGIVTGHIAFNPGIAPLGPTCTASTVSSPGGLSSHAFVLDTQIVGYAGPITINISGSTFCETFSAGSGVLTGTISGFQQLNQGKIDCPPGGQPLQGGFQRIFTQIRIRLAGPCEINEFGTSNISFVGELNFVPDGLEDGRPVGVLQPVTGGQVRGPFAVTPG